MDVRIISEINREYTAKNFKAPQDLSAEGLLGPNSNTFLFEAKMQPPSSTHGNKVSTAYKTVFTEYMKQVIDKTEIRPVLALERVRLVSRRLQICQRAPC